MNLATAKRISVICATLSGLLRELPDQPMRAQLVDLAEAAEAESDILRVELSNTGPALVSVK
jgi:hypothetical protein